MELEKLKKIITEVLNVDESEITMDTKFIDDLGADSLDVIEMLMTLEDEYGITIPDEKINQIYYTVQEQETEKDQQIY